MFYKKLLLKKNNKVYQYDKWLRCQNDKAVKYGKETPAVKVTGA